MPIIGGIRTSQRMRLYTQKARNVSIRLNQAMDHGEQYRDVRACEAAYR